MYKRIRNILFDAYKKGKRKEDFDSYLFRNNLFFLLPGEYSAKVKVMIFFNKKKRSLQKKYIKLINSFSKEKNIPVVFLKGLILAERLYSNPTERLSADIDIFINQKNCNILNSFFVKNGFTKELDATGFHYSFVKNDNGEDIVVELHTKLFPISAQIYSVVKNIDEPEVIIRTEIYKNEEVCVLDYNYEFLYLFIHIMRHFIDGILQLEIFNLSKFPIARYIELILDCQH